MNLGVAVDYKELVKLTTASVIDAINARSLVPLNPVHTYRMYYKDGCDGAGSHSLPGWTRHKLVKDFLSQRRQNWSNKYTINSQLLKEIF